MRVDQLYNTLHSIPFVDKLDCGIHGDRLIRQLPILVQTLGTFLRQKYPELKVPRHTRRHHLLVDGQDRLANFRRNLPDLFDLIFYSCVLDAGAGAQWSFLESATGKTYTRSEVLEMEAKICNALKFNFNYVTPYQFVHRFLRASHVSSRCSTSASLLPGDELGMIHNGANNEINVLLKKLVLYLLDLAVLEYELVKNKPSLTTAAAVYLARATLGIRESSTFASASATFLRMLSISTDKYWPALRACSCLASCCNSR